MTQDPLPVRIVVDDEDDAVARAVLLILQTIVPPREDPSRSQDWRFVSEDNVSSTREAMERLSRMPKPLVCEAARVDSVIEISCGKPGDNPRWEWWAQTHADTPLLSELELEEIERTGNRRVMLAGPTESIVLDVDQLEQMSKEYVILGNYTVSSFLASRFDSAPDVAVVERYFPSTTATTVSVTDD